MRTTAGLIFVAAIAATLVATASGAAAQAPSGERDLGRSVVEPGYDMSTGNGIFILTPGGSQSAAHVDANAVSPLYIVVYPSSAKNAVGTMNCAHEGGDNCPDHGPGIAALAQSLSPVYAGGVWGHDHLLAGPGSGEFNVGREVVVVLFADADAANEHIVTEARLQAALDAGTAFAVDTTTLIHASLVSRATYARATPVPAGL